MVGIWRGKSFLFWKASLRRECSENRLASYADLSTRLYLQSFVMCWVAKRLYARNPFLLTKRWTEVLETESAEAISLIELWVPGYSSWEQINSSTNSSFSDVAAVAFFPPPFFSLSRTSFLYLISKICYCVLWIIKRWMFFPNTSWGPTFLF